MLACRWIWDRCENGSLRKLDIDATACGVSQDGKMVCTGDPCGKCAELRYVLLFLAMMMDHSDIALHLEISGELHVTVAVRQMHGYSVKCIRAILHMFAHLHWEGTEYAS